VLALPEKDRALMPTSGELIAHIDSVAGGTINEVQRQTIKALRDGIHSLAYNSDTALSISKPERESNLEPITALFFRTGQ
jgi:hypothetical protein